MRMNKRTKIKRELEKAGIKDFDDLTFKSLFSKKKSKKVLFNTLEEIKSKYPKLLITDYDSIENFMIDVQMENPKMNIHTLMKVTGLYAILKEKGVRTLRNIIDRYDKKKLV